MKRIILISLCLCCLACGAFGAKNAPRSMRESFITAPASARPWVYWFWLNGNITREGITADLEAMKRVGIGGVLIMEVDQGAPVGPVDFMSDKWRELFKHVVSEAGRLGLEVNMNDDAGWNGSGGPWIKPEQSMQKVVWTSKDVTGPAHFEEALEQPKSVAGFYQDIAVMAYPAADAVEPGQIVDISAKMDSAGRLAWDVPEGKWTIVRFGQTSTGKDNHPAPATGRGLECDKLSKEGSEANFNGMIAKLVQDNPGAKALVATHVDSWENGSQNWTERMREEFRQRRGYDMLPYLPVLAGQTITSKEISDRFQWDLRRTVSELVVENYAGHIRDLAHANGLRFTCEAYGSPCDYLPYGGQADEPMGEFWDPSGAMETCKGMASAGHIYGKRIIGAEAFTANSDERWRHSPRDIKALGDLAFCNGINRFVFHRYAMQPWVTNERPGMTMGPWGQHYERTQTWWDLTPSWHQYLARCQYMLRQGLFAADICYLQPEAPPKGFDDHPRLGYDWDECPAEVVMTRMSVKDGRIVLPDGMSYKLLVLPDTKTMTPALLRKIGELVKSGATVIGTPPQASPSLSDYPKCDEEVKQLAKEIWGDCDGKNVKMHRYGLGAVICSSTPEEVLAGIAPDFKADAPLRFIHRKSGGTDIYFVSNPYPRELTATATFRVAGKTPELWWPDTGKIERAAVYRQGKSTTSVSLPLGPSGSVFVCFADSSPGNARRGYISPTNGPRSISGVSRDGKPVLTTLPAERAAIRIEKAAYGVLDDPARTRDVKAKVQAIVDGGRDSFRVSELAAGDDPAYGIVKTVVIDYTVAGKKLSATGQDPDTIFLSISGGEPAPCEIHDDGGKLSLIAWQPGRYAITGDRGTNAVDVKALPKPVEIAGPWSAGFSLSSEERVGVRSKTITLPRLESWSENEDPDIKYFSGTAVYRANFDVPKGLIQPGRVLKLDLGDVQVMARVKLNGKDLGTLWKPPFTADVTGLIKPGKNTLEVNVTNLWINRMIGDEQLPEDSDRNGNGTLKSWPEWLLAGKHSPTGRQTFTSWRLWKKTDALFPSGLLGPVRVVVGKRVAI